MKRLILLSAITLILTSASANTDLLDELDAVMKQKKEFNSKKNAKINILKSELGEGQHTNSTREYWLCLSLFEEYRSYLYDSAYYYVEQAKRKAGESGDMNLVSYAKIKEGFVYLSSGLFKEALDTLQSISVVRLPDSLKYEYYSTLARTYFDLADYDKDPAFGEKYRKVGNTCLNSAQGYVSKSSSKYWSIEGLKRMKTPDWNGALAAFEYWIKNFKLNDHDYAIATSSLGYICQELNRMDDAKKYLILASIADIKASTRETVALRNLSNILFREGDTKQSYIYINEALKDASQYNARHRKIEIASILPIIEGERLTAVEAQKTKITGYALVITMLVVLVLFFLGVIYRQLRKLKHVRVALQESNDSLNSMNRTLKEANTIKEEYIGYFFNVNSEFINRLDVYQKSIQRKVVSRQFDDLSSIIKNTELKKERELLYENFDKIFVKLFPNFVKEYNSLFRDEDRVVLNQNELLTPELRIFAMMRLGIKDNEKIAKFLNYSVTTIYTYKTKAKAKSICRDSFEESVMGISAF